MENTFGSDGSVLTGAAASFGLIAAAFLVLVPGLEKTARAPQMKSVFVVLLAAPLYLVGAAFVLVIFRNLAVSALCLILAIIIEPIAVTLVLLLGYWVSERADRGRQRKGPFDDSRHATIDRN